MLGYCRNHKDYTTFVLTELRELEATRPDQIEEYKEAIVKMLILNLDPLIPIISPLYSSVGKPAEMQPDIFRSFVLMKHTGIPLNKWVEKLSVNPVLRTIAGFTLENMPKTSSYYDFIDRIVPLDEPPEVRPVKIKPKEKLKKGEKLPPKNPGIVADLVNNVISDEKRFQRRLSRRPERFLQRIFARVAVDASKNMGLIPDDISVSGDGTCIKTGASSYGKKVCKCREKGVYKCACDRKFSDPNATWGWDSHNERYFYGYSGYFISTYNRDLKVDLPLYLRLVQANRHDSVSAVFALSEFRELSPNLNIDTFISDSAYRQEGRTPEGRRLRSKRTEPAIITLHTNCSTTGILTPSLHLTKPTRGTSNIRPPYISMSTASRCAPQDTRWFTTVTVKAAAA